MKIFLYCFLFYTKSFRLSVEFIQNFYFVHLFTPKMKGISKDFEIKKTEIIKKKRQRTIWRNR